MKPYRLGGKAVFWGRYKIARGRGRKTEWTPPHPMSFFWCALPSSICCLKILHPPSHCLCAAWIEQNPREDTGLWMLKNNKQRGTGLRLVKTQEAFDACFETTTRPGLEGMILYR